MGLTATEAKLIEAGNALARATGHRISRGCPKLSPAVTCTCGASAEQSQALSDWDNLVDQIKKGLTRVWVSDSMGL
jgi:hypothetical protein